MSKAGNPALIDGEYIKDPKTGKLKLVAAVALGSRKSDAKAAASRENGRKSKPGPGAPPKPLSEIACKCAAGDGLDGHRWDCPRGQAIKRRIKENRDIQTGAKLDSGDGWGTF